MYELGFILLLAVQSPEEAAPPDVRPFSERVFGALGAVPAECLRGVQRKFKAGAVVECAFPDIKRKQFVEQWDAAFPDDVVSESVALLSAWNVTLGGWYRRYLTVDGAPVIVTYGGKQPGMAIAYYSEPDCREGDSSLPWSGAPGLSPPERIPGEWVNAVYPKPARSRRINGMVLLRAVIDELGNTTSLCVLDEQPPGYGFAESTLEAYLPHRYEPAHHSGTPTPVQHPLAKVFEID